MMGGIDRRVRVAPVSESRRVNQSQVARRLGGQVENIPTLFCILVRLAIDAASQSQAAGIERFVERIYNIQQYLVLRS